jgi:hypothetical protein
LGGQLREIHQQKITNLETGAQFLLTAMQNFEGQE